MKKNFLLSFVSAVVGVFVAIFFIDGAAFLFHAIGSVEGNSEEVSESIVIEDEVLPEDDIEEDLSPESLFMFRGNKERNFYGTGPVPETPKILWRYPESPMCSYSPVRGIQKHWCGTGWTGQPVVWEQDSITEIIFGAYDGAIHFLDADTGVSSREKFQTGDIIKGSFTLDPDGYPLLYGGSRDNKMRVIALDQDTPKELWALDSDELPEGIWNNDWDSNPVVVDDILYQGGENGYFYAVRLGRSYDTNGKVQVSPKIIYEYAGFNDDLIEKTDENLSMESSPLVVDGVVYVTNSGGRIMGFKIKKIKRGVDPLVFDFWVGDDVDATMVTDGSGAIYVAVEKERFNNRSAEVGQLIKLNPKSNNPIVWSLALPEVSKDGKGGIWSTPAIYGGYLYVTTHVGELLVVNKDSGEIVWRKDIGYHAWSSPSVVDNALIVGTCFPGGIQAYELSNPSSPKLLWDKKVGEGCIESTPAIWNGNMYVGNRDGFFYKIGE